MTSQIKGSIMLSILLLIFTILSVQAPLLEAHGQWTCQTCVNTFTGSMGREPDRKTSWMEGLTQVFYYAWEDPKTGKVLQVHTDYKPVTKCIVEVATSDAGTLKGIELQNLSKVKIIDIGGFYG